MKVLSVAFAILSANLFAADIIEGVDPPGVEPPQVGEFSDAAEKCKVTITYVDGDCVIALVIGGRSGEMILPEWVRIKSVVFGDDEIAFAIWIDNDGLFWPVAVLMSKVQDDNIDVSYFKVDFKGWSIKRIVSIEKGVVTALGGSGHNLDSTGKSYKGGWVKFALSVNELEEIEWKDVELERRQRINWRR